MTTYTFPTRNILETAANFFLLRENGDKILREGGTDKIILTTGTTEGWSYETKH